MLILNFTVSNIYEIVEKKKSNSGKSFEASGKIADN